MKKWTIRLSYRVYWTHEETVKASTLEEACAKAIRRGNESPDWCDDGGDPGPTFVEAIDGRFDAVPEAYSEETIHKC